MEDKDLNPTLRDAYRRAPETARPSDLLWRRTRRALLKRGLLRDRSRRPMRGLLAAVAASAALGGFLLGLAAGRSVAPPRPPAQTASVVPSTAAERVQGAGTDYALALEALARSLDSGTAAQVARGQEVLMALTEVHDELISGLAPRRMERVAGAGAAPSDSEGSATTPLVWF